MADTERLLEQRKKMKAKKPEFLMQDSWKRKELPKKWRKPKGLHSKMRLKKKGYPKMVSPGYGSPRAVKGFSREGFRVRNICSLKELKNVGKEAIIISRIGIKKKLELVREAIKMKITIINLPEPEKYLASVEERRKKEQIAKKEKLMKKEKMEKAVEKKKEKPLEETISEDEKKKIADKEKEKVLTKRE